MSILVFTDLTEAVNCNEAIMQRASELYRQAGFNIIDNEIELVKGKQRIERWDIVRKAINDDIWWIYSPRSRSPDNFDDITQGFAFIEQDGIDITWLPDTANNSPQT